jgi:hypothetical protein
VLKQYQLEWDHSQQVDPELKFKIDFGDIFESSDFNGGHLLWINYDLFSNELDGHVGYEHGREHNVPDDEYVFVFLFIKSNRAQVKEESSDVETGNHCLPGMVEHAVSTDNESVDLLTSLRQCLTGGQ